MKKKRWMAAGLAAVMTLSLAACGSSGGDSDSGSDSGGKKKISMSVWNGNWAEDLQAFEDDFIIPIVLLYILAQKYITSGITAGAIKM